MVVNFSRVLLKSRLTLHRDLREELYNLGLTDEQCGKVLAWSETLPYLIKCSAENVKVTFKDGIINVEPHN